MGLFKSGRQREAERGLKLRRAKSRLSKQVGKLKQQRERYLEMGRQAAAEGKADKVRLLAKSVLQFRRMEKRFQDVLLTLELFEAQRDMMTVQSDFIGAMRGAAMSIRDSNVTGELSKMENQFQEALAMTEEAGDRIDAFLETGAEDITDIGATEGEDEELKALVADMTQGAQEQERAAVPDAIEDDIAAIQQQLKKENNG
jgi:division protein CdvB (Snf7/Vps24/ESCRT-III family)